MEEFINNFRKELDDFWKWQGLSLEEYKTGTKQFKDDECVYPNWCVLTNYADKAISILSKNIKNVELIELLLEFIAIDNESEITMEKCEILLAAKAIEWIAEVAISFQLYEARWQIAVLLGRGNKDIFEKYLSEFIKDENKYVQRRALLSLSQLNPKRAEEISIEKLNDCDEYLRFVSLMILRELKSNYLSHAIKLLESDPSEFVQREIEWSKEDISNRRDKKGNFI